MKALIVEDDRILSNNICESLKHKFDMTQAFDGEEGLERLARESFDVIILDVMMPRLNGYEVLEQMRGGGITTPGAYADRPGTGFRPGEGPAGGGGRLPVQAL